MIEIGYDHRSYSERMSTMRNRYRWCWFSVSSSHVRDQGDWWLPKVTDSWGSMEGCHWLSCSASVYYLRMNVSLRSADNNDVDACAPLADDYVDGDDCVPCWSYYLYY